MTTTNNNYKQNESFLYQAGTNMKYEYRSQIATDSFLQKKRLSILEVAICDFKSAFTFLKSQYVTSS